MTSFTIFYNAKIDKFTAVYDFNLPTVTGIGTRKEWQAVFHGQASDIFDKAEQCKAFAEQYRLNMPQLDENGAQSDFNAKEYKYSSEKKKLAKGKISQIWRYQEGGRT